MHASLTARTPPYCQASSITTPTKLNLSGKSSSNTVTCLRDNLQFAIDSLRSNRGLVSVPLDIASLVPSRLLDLAMLSKCSPTASQGRSHRNLRVSIFGKSHLFRLVIASQGLARASANGL